MDPNERHVAEVSKGTALGRASVQRSAALECMRIALPPFRWRSNTAPRNRLEALKRDRKGQHSIRINDQFRVCFRWTTAGPSDVEIVDYHE